VHDLARLELWRQHREELLKELDNARLAREIRRGRKRAGGEWRINLGGWIPRSQRASEYEARPAAKS
jgi:hypothetical protein